MLVFNDHASRDYKHMSRPPQEATSLLPNAKECLSPKGLFIMWLSACLLHDRLIDVLRG